MIDVCGLLKEFGVDDDFPLALSVVILGAILKICVSMMLSGCGPSKQVVRAAARHSSPTRGKPPRRFWVCGRCERESWFCYCLCFVDIGLAFKSIIKLNIINIIDNSISNRSSPLLISSITFITTLVLLMNVIISNFLFFNMILFLVIILT